MRCSCANGNDTAGMTGFMTIKGEQKDMFYETDSNIIVAHFGKGDILLCPGKLEDDTAATVSLVDNCGKCNPINEPTMSEEEWEAFKAEKGLRTDEDLNTVIRLVFDKPESIDCMIWALNEAKKQMGWV
jgi:hypothetical protein